VNEMSQDLSTIYISGNDYLVLTTKLTTKPLLTMTTPETDGALARVKPD
jgi:hypothetical protein